MLPNFNQAFGSVCNRAEVEPVAPAAESDMLVITTSAPAPQVTTPAVESSVAAGTSSDNDVRTILLPLLPTRLPSFSQAFNCIRTRRQGGVTLQRESPSDGMIVTSALQTPRVSSAVVNTVPIIPAAESQSPGDVYMLEFSPSYEPDHIKETSGSTRSASLSPPYRHRSLSPPQKTHNRVILKALRRRYSRLEDSQMQAKIRSELQREDNQNEALDLANWSDRTEQETSRPPRPCSLPPSLDFTPCSHPRAIQRHNSLPLKFKRPPLPTRAALRKVSAEEIEDYWKDIMECIIKDLRSMGLDVDALEPFKQAWSLGKK